MKAKIMTWEEFREVTREDAYNWYQSGYKSTELSEKAILAEYPEDYFCDDTADYYDDLSSAFTPSEMAAATLEALKELESYGQ